jgi:iron complex outermembrane receptor protein
MLGWKALRRSLMVCLSISLLSPFAMAAATPNFDLPAQPLADSLRAVASETNTNILFDPPLVASKSAPALRATLSTDQALSWLLRGTGIKQNFLNESTVVLEPDSTNANPVGTSDVTSASKEGKTDASGSFRVAQVAQGSVAGVATMSRPSAPLQDAATSLSEIVVTAQKREERLQDVPVPVTAISAADLIETGQVRLEDYYSSVPGLSAAPGAFTGGSPNLAIRGITTGGGNPGVGVTIDDVPFGATTQVGGGLIVPDLDPSDLARIEVLRGPQGTLYGASSIGGLIKYVTLDPSMAGFSGSVQAGTSGVYNGPNLGYSFRGSLNVPLNDTLAIRASGFTREDPGYIDNVENGERGVNETKVSGGLLAALWRPVDELSLKLQALYQHTTAGSPAFVDQRSITDVPLGDLQQSTIPGSGALNSTIQAYNATVVAKLGTIDLTSVSGYNIHKTSEGFDYTDALGTFTQSEFGVQGTPLFSDFETDKFTQEIRLSSSIGSIADWLLGGFYNHENTQETQQLWAAVPTTGAIVGHWAETIEPNTIREYASFGDLTVHFTDRFDVQFGGRASENKQTYMESFIGSAYDLFFLQRPSPVIYPQGDSSDHSFTYLVTPRMKLSPDLMVYARLASGYRPGGPNLVAADLGLPTTYKPDRTENFELGVKGNAFNHLLSFDGSLYYIDWKDIQLSLVDPRTDQGYSGNGSRAKSQGLELSAEARPWEGLTITAWTVWNDAELTAAIPPGGAGQVVGADGARLPYASRFSAYVSVADVVTLTSRLSAFAGASASYIGERFGDFNSSPMRQDLPGYTKLDFHAGAKMGSWTTTFFINNLADRRGLLAGGIGSDNPNAFYYIPPRTLGVNVAKTF